MHFRNLPVRGPVGSRWLSARAAAYAMASVPAAAIAYLLMRMPLQVTDCLTLILDAAAVPSAWDAFYNHLHGDGYFRPALYAQIKLLFDVSHGHYHFTYRLFHAASVAAYILMFVRLLELRTRTAALLVPFALTVFVGIHTFLPSVKELYPVNHFLQIALLALVALNLAESKGGVLVELGLAATFLAAALTLESGLLVAVVIVAAWVAGAPGVSRRGIAIVCALLAGYFAARFLVFGTGMPGLEERSAGFLLARLDPPELRRIFGDNLVPFYVYNVGASISSVLFSEPRSGVWIFIRQLLAGDVPPRTYVNIGASLFATGLIGLYVIDRLRTGVRRPATLSDRYVFVFAAVLAANAVLSFSYTKDEIVSVAGTFYSLAVFAAAAHVVDRLQAQKLPRTALVVVTVVLAVGSTLWAVRAAGVHHVLRSQAFVQRNHWAHVDEWLTETGNAGRYATMRPIIAAIRRQSLDTPVVNPRFVPRWADRIFDADY